MDKFFKARKKVGDIYFLMNDKYSTVVKIGFKYLLCSIERPLTIIRMFIWTPCPAKKNALMG